MIHTITEWLAGNKTELLGAILGILYIRFSIRQSILTWPTGLLTSLLYVIVFFKSALYAAMGLQVYYVAISFYGWYFWLKGKNTNNKSLLPVMPEKSASDIENASFIPISSRGLLSSKNVSILNFGIVRITSRCSSELSIFIKAGASIDFSRSFIPLGVFGRIIFITTSYPLYGN